MRKCNARIWEACEPPRLPMPVTRSPFVLTTPTDDRINADVYIDPGARDCPIVVMIHGYTGFKDWGSMPATGAWFAERGYAAVAFNFSHNGIGDDPMKITEKERFAQNTISRELDELELLITTLRGGAFPGGAQCDCAAIVLLGHSRGGAEAIIAGKELGDVRAVASWGGIAHFDRWTDRLKAKWRSEGARALTSSWLDSPLHMGIGFLHDLEANAERLNIRACAAQLHKPLLLLHGAQDITVSPDEARQLYDAADHTMTQIEIIPATGHTFGAGQPYTDMPHALDTALQLTDTFFRKALATA